MEPIRLNQEVSAAETLQFRCSTASRASVRDGAAATFRFFAKNSNAGCGSQRQAQVSDETDDTGVDGAKENSLPFSTERNRDE